MILRNSSSSIPPPESKRLGRDKKGFAIPDIWLNGRWLLFTHRARHQIMSHFLFPAHTLHTSSSTGISTCKVKTVTFYIVPSIRPSCRMPGLPNFA